MKPGTDVGLAAVLAKYHLFTRHYDSVLTSGNVHVPYKSFPEARRLISGQRNVLFPVQYCR